MARLSLIGAVLLALLAAGCDTVAIVPEVATPTEQATSSPAPTEMLPTPFPTPAEVAPEQTFTNVGSIGFLSGDHGISGKAIVAGLQTLIIQGFNFDGKGPPADIRLVKGQDYDNPADVLAVLDQRSYENEMFLLIVPNEVTRENADRLVVYAPETGQVYAETTFD